MISDRQICALKFFVFNSKDANILAKQIVASLLSHTERLSKSARYEFRDNHQGYTREELEEAFEAIRLMLSDLGSTHFNELLCAATYARLTISSGNGVWKCCISVEDEPAYLTAVSKDELDLIDVTQHGLRAHVGKKALLYL